VTRAFYKKIKIAVELVALLGLSVTLGCGHESAASPVEGAVVAAAPMPTASQASDDIAAIDDATPALAANAPGAAEHETALPMGGSASEEPAAAANPPATGQRPPADRAPRRPGEAEKITFEDLNLGMQADVVFRPFMLSDRVKELVDQRISISGYMHGGQSTQRGIKDFILLKNNQCKFGPGGQADHLANVVLRPGATTSFTPSPVKVEGTLKIEPFEGPDRNTWYVYRVEDAQIR
jgi:hypothetical protein